MRWINQLPGWIVYGLVVPLIALNGWVALQLFAYFQSILTIIIVATLLSFVLDYPVQWLQRLSLPRGRAILLVLLTTLTVLLLLGITLIPLLVNQINQLGDRLPVWAASGNQQLQALQTWSISRNLPIDLSHVIVQLENSLSTQIQDMSGAFLSFLPDAVGSLLNVLLTIVLTFYLLLQGDRLWDGIFQWFPQKTGKKVRSVLRQNFHNYFLGQMTLALMIGTGMTIAFLLIQVPFGLLFGLGIGLLAIFPFGSALGIVIVSCLTALNSVWLGVRVLVVATVLDQVIESAIAPQLLGSFTGLSPAWILISLLIGAKIAGLLGLVLAVPFASSVKRLLVHSAARVESNP